MWEELGIPATSDEFVVRRAYAARLKSLDIDREPAAFMRLRQAYEQALEDACPEARDPEQDTWQCCDGDCDASPAGTDDRTAEAPEPVPAPLGHNVREADRRVPYAALAQFRAEFYDLVNAGDTKAAVAALASALANGIVPLGAEAEYLRAAAVCARTDMALAPDMLIEIARMFGGGAARFNDPLSEFAREFHEKAEAMRWLARVEQDSARGDRLFGLWARYARRRTRVARAILDIANTNLLSSDLPELRAEVDNARRYAPWLAGKIVPEPLEAKRAMLESTLRGHEILAIVVGAIMYVLLGLWYLMSS